MMNCYDVVVQQAAQNDLFAIWEYIALELKEPVTAARMLDKLQTAVVSLARLPERQGLVRDEFLAGQGIRVLPVEQYLIFYVVSQSADAVNIIRILYGKRDWQSIL